MKNLKIVAIAGITLTSFALLTSCGDQAPSTAFIDRANMDTTVQPGTDFFKYANGQWLKNTEIPGDKPRWGSFDELREKTDESVHELLKTVKTDATDIKEANVAKFYKSGMDTAEIEKLGVNAIKTQLDKISSMTSAEDILNMEAENIKKGLSSIVGMYIGPDDKNVNKVIINLYQSGLGLPNKDYYTDNDPTSKENRAAYIQYITQILELSGQDAAAAKVNADKVFAIESKLANISLRPQEMRDPVKMYNKFSIDDFSKKTPNIDWKSFFSKLNINGQDSMLVGTVKYYTTLSSMLKSTPVEDWKHYYTFHTASDMAPYLSQNFADASFNFFSKKLKGLKEQTPRWKRVKGVINGLIGDQLGALYVDKNFQPEAKVRMQELVSNLQEAFAERVKGLDWMGAATKQKALTKLNSFTRKIGYPDEFKKYDGLKLSNNYAENILNAKEFAFNRQVAKIGKPVNKKEWFMTPNTVNAYYNPAFNEIVFPAAILQFPFFDFKADDAINYGGIGAVIGHEMTHGFDDQGAQYAADGNLSNWWTDEDLSKFKEKSSILVKQYNNFKVLDTVPVNGELTLGENIADLGGVAIAYQAFKKTKQGQSEELIDGFTPDQRFFLSWAQIWRGKARPEYALQLIKTDPHSPGAARANLPLSNFDPFYKAFSIKEGDKMYIKPEERAKIW